MRTIAIELAQAYVSITPSLRGAKRQIESDLAGVDTSTAGSQIGEQLSSSIGKSLDLRTIGTRLQDIGSQISTIGGNLTKYVTAPALVAAGAVAGITASLGWGRLVALDSAQAQLRGLGYAAEDVARISAQVTDAVQGGMTTMAEGTAIAAGALAAGVDEGAELERYIRLVGDAAVGANRPVNEMAQIFNRVQGGGRLMTQELNMIEDGLPGFAATMAESMGVSQTEFREMVTAGEVSSQDFLNVMDDFAGGMASAYADSWSGMVANTKAWVGIVGETILSGAFQSAKVELESFQEWLKTDEVQEWAAQAGEAVGRAFSSIIEAIRNAITWWGNLDSSTQRTIGIFAGIAVAAGPVLMVVGRIVSAIGGLLRFISPVVAAVGRWAAASGGLGAAVGRLLPMLLRFAGPIGLIVTALISAWQSSDEFRSAVTTLGQTLMETLQTVWGIVQPVLEGLMGLFQEIVTTAIVPLATTLMTILVPAIQAVLPVVETVFGVIAEVITAVMEIVRGVIETVMGIITGDWDRAWAGIEQIFSGVWDAIVAIVTGAVRIVASILSGAWNMITAVTSGAWNAIRGAIMAPINAARDAVASAVRSVLSFMTSTWASVSGVTTRAWNGIKTAVGRAIASVVTVVRGLPGRAVSALGNIGSTLVSAGGDLIGGFIRGITNMAGRLISAIRSTITDRLPGFVKSALGIRSPSRLFAELGADVMAGFAQGLSSGGGDVLDEMDAVVADLTRAPQVDLTARGGLGPVGGRMAPAAGGASGRAVTNNIYETSDPRSTAEQVVRRMALAGA